MPPERIAWSILSIRGNRVIVDADLAELYGVATKVLNQAVKRNRKRFPQDFMFRLSKMEKSEVVTNCDHLAQKLQRRFGSLVSSIQNPCDTFLWCDRYVPEARQPHQTRRGAFRFRDELALRVVHVDFGIFTGLGELGG